MSTINNKRIAKNTGMLYIRMILITFVSLFTSRIVLKILGVEDFGVYNVVGGMVGMFIFLNGALSSASSRFIAYEIGKNNEKGLKEIFKTLLSVNILFAIIIFVLLETVGLWFLNHKLVIPPERMVAANWIFQFSTLSSVILLIQIPFTSLIIAHEKMDIYAYLGIYDVLLKLSIVFSLNFFKYDKLIIYGVLLCLNSIIIFLTYNIYCKTHFKETSYKLTFNAKRFIEILSYSGWSFIGSFSNIMKLQGINILLNIFFGPSVNAARGIAYQVNNAVNSFTQNFTIAINPQVIKNYANGTYSEVLSLIIRGSKMSFFLLQILGMPLILETKFILELWLVDVPEYAIIFTRLIIFNSLIESFTFVLGSAIQATGNIKWYQIGVGLFLLLNLPISYLALKSGFPPESTVFVSIFLALIALFIRLIILKKELHFLSIKTFIIRVYGTACTVFILSLITPLLIILTQNSSWERFIWVSATGVITAIGSIYFIGLNGVERNFVKRMLLNILTNKQYDK